MIRRASLIKLTTGVAMAFGFALTCCPAYSWTRIWCEDILLVERSELIVVGRIKRGSLISAPPAPGFTQYHARLAITSVLKGSTDDADIPVIIYHGLTPDTGGRIGSIVIDDGKGGIITARWPAYAGTREDAIPIVDTGGSAVSLGPIIQDAGEDNLWFLRRRSGNYGREAGTGDFGIVDPEDLEPLPLEDYFRAYLSADPEAGVKGQLALHPEIARRAGRYLDHLEVQRILALPDPETRIQRLLPFYIKGQSWGAAHEARRGITDCGEASTPYLRRLLHDPEFASLKSDIIGMLGEASIRSRIHIMEVRELLEDHNRFWSQQRLEEDWWDQDSASELTQQRRRLYDEMRSSVVTLGKIGDDSAIDAINETKATWVRIDDPRSGEIVRQCDEALRLIDERKHTSEK